ncbi:hypothetical protein AAFG07_33260 [Bradyrhizobium sp. B097]|uniref:hypothetical protein n=1 Tax=Bradyrhizobium sp. B097 TaxID=3140244 RepID=UPI0031830BF2
MLKRYDLIMAIYITRHGFAFALFEGALAPLDWGVIRRSEPNKNRRCIKAATALIERCRPDCVVLQDTSWTGTRRSQRTSALNAAFFELADCNDIPVCVFTRERVHVTFADLGQVTKHSIAEAIAKRIPAFERYVPPRRKPWMSEDDRMGLFDAAALALTFFREVGESRREVA